MSYKEISLNVKRIVKFLKRCVFYAVNVPLKVALVFNNKLLLKLISLGSYDTIYEFRVFEDIANLEKTNGDKVEILYKDKVVLHYTDPIFNKILKKNTNLVEVHGYEQYGAVLYDVSIIGDSNVVVLDKDRILLDLKFNDTEKRYKYTNRAIERHNDDRCILAYKKAHQSIDEAISLVGIFSQNYYHLLVETIVKFEKINGLGIDINTPILIDRSTINIPNYLELITYFNKDKRQLIPVEPREQYNVRKLYYFSSPNIIPPNYKNDNDIRCSDLLYDLSSLEYVRQSLLPYKSTRSFPKKIYLSRKNASDRRQFNEEAVSELLVRYGFEIVFPENYTISEQIALFNNAEFIIGGSGAAFTNLLYCNDSCKVIVFLKKEIPFSGFSTIAGFVGCDLVNFTEDLNLNVKLRKLHQPFELNINRLESFLRDFSNN